MNYKVIDKETYYRKGVLREQADPGGDHHAPGLRPAGLEQL